jgi:hypothetical protein
MKSCVSDADTQSTDTGIDKQRPAPRETCCCHACARNGLLIHHPVANRLHNTVIRPRRTACRHTHDQIHLRHKINVVACFAEWSFDREFSRLAIDRHIHETVERRRDIILCDAVPLQCERQISKAPVVRLLVWIAQAESVFRTRRHDEIVPSNSVFYNCEEGITAVAVELIACAQVDLAGVVECSPVRECLTRVGGVVRSDVGDLFSLRVDYD